MNEDLLYLIGLVLGDESGDGHDKFYQYSIYSNLDDEQLREAFKSGCNKVDVEFSDIVAEEYEECMLKSDILEKLQKAGLNISSIFEQYHYAKDTGEYRLNTKSFTLIWLWIAQQGNPNFKYEFVKNKEIYLGGYGLFT
jgi:hypothetical protein